MSTNSFFYMTQFLLIDRFNHEFIIVIFIHYKPRIAIAILDLLGMKMT